MALMNVSENSGSFMPICKYDARAGRIFRVDKADGTSTPVDITRQFRAVFDFEAVEIGYILFSAGGAPVFTLVPYGQPMPAKPSHDAKQGIRMHIKLAPVCACPELVERGGDVRELAGTSNVFLRGINTLHDEYERGKAANPGKLPIVSLADTIPVETGGGAKKSVNYMPVFTIAGWAPRPAGMGAQGASAATVVAAVMKAASSNAATNDAMLEGLHRLPHGLKTSADDFGD